LQRRSIPRIESPDDLVPRTKTFKERVSGAGNVTVVIDPEEQVAEIWEGNNRVRFVVPR
jgi:subtilase family serine protease